MTDPDNGRTGSSRGPRPSRGGWQREHRTALLWLIATISALEAAVSPARPVGFRAADVFWCALLGAAIPLIASRARRWALIGAGGVAAVVGIGGDSVGQASALALILLMLLVAFSDRRDRLVAALMGAFAVQALLRGPAFEPVWLAALIGIVALAPLVWSGRRMARGRERRAGTRLAFGIVVLVGIFTIGASVAALDARADLQSGADGAIAGVDALRSGQTPAASNAFEASAADFTRASSSVTGPLSWGGRYLPIVGQHVAALREVASAGNDLATSAGVTASTADYRSLTAEGGRVDLVKVRALQGPVSASAQTISSALATVAAVRSPWLLRPVTSELDRFDARLADIGEQTELASAALAVAPDILGGNGPRRYFLAFSTPAESRDGGGFIGAYGLLAADTGQLDLLESGTLGLLNRDGPYRFDPPPDWDLRYGSNLVERFLGNLGASPDWPTGTNVAGQLFPQTPGGERVDGALYADPRAMAGLLRLTGPVAVAGLDVILDADNAEEFLLREQYVRFDGDNRQRRELLGDVARATFDALTSRPLPGIEDLTKVLGPLVEGGHLRLSVFDDTSEAFLDRIGLSGVWAPRPGADLLSVRSANTLSNKIDAYLYRDIDVATTVDPGRGTVQSSVKVRLRNDAPSSGLPDYVIGNNNGLPPGTNRTMVTVHSPHRLESVTLDGQPTPVQTQREFGQPVYSVVVDLPAGATRTLEYRLAGAAPQDGPYHLQILAQAMANPDQMSVRIGTETAPRTTPQFSGVLRVPVLVVGP